MGWGGGGRVTKQGWGQGEGSANRESCRWAAALTQNGVENWQAAWAAPGPSHATVWKACPADMGPLSYNLLP